MGELNMGLVGEKTHLRKIDTPILTTFLQEAIFVPAKKGVSRGIDNFREIVINKSKSETITVTGPVLDMNKDFLIWATVLKEVDKQGSFKISLTENDFLHKIGYSVNNTNSNNKKKIEKRIENMMKVNVKIEIDNKEKNRDCTYFINIFSTGSWDRSSKKFTFSINEDLFNAYSKIKWKALDLDYYQKIKTDYAKALFCFYESHSDNLIPIKRDKLLIRLGLDKYSRKNNAYRKLKEAHELLKNIGFLKNYIVDSSCSDGNVYYKAFKTPKKDRIFGI
jgi:hypothetical protein